MTYSLEARLTVDLDAIVANWRALDALSPPDCQTGAVVKSDGYGCGVVRVSQALSRAGVGTFFVALPGEGVALRAAVGPAPVIYVLGGYGRAEAGLYRQHDLRPALNSGEQARDWFADMPGAPAAVQLDTGLNRLGMEAEEFVALGPLPDQISLVLSHMGNADDPDHPMNSQQLAEFRRMTDGVAAPKSLSATGGLLLGADWHFDMVRMGIGLYGGWPFEAARRVVTVEVPIIQIRDLAEGESVGYGATWIASRPSRIATVSAGYADGLIRAMGHGGGTGWLNGTPVPFAGRVSMDLITLDVTDVACAPGDMIELIGAHQSIDDVARHAGTIGHEILTSLGPRYTRQYTG